MHHLLTEHSLVFLVALLLCFALLASYTAFRLARNISSSENKSIFRSLTVDRRLAEQIALKASILESAIDGIFMFKSQGWIIEFNPAAQALFGYTRIEALHLTIFDLLFPDHLNGQEASLLYEQLANKSSSLIGKRLEVTAYRADRTSFPAEMIITHFVFRNKTIYTAYIRDLTEIRQSEERIHQLAYFDHLTGLPNRNQFHQQFQAALDCAREREESVGVIFLDIYRFKWINDSFGHHAGDHILQKFAALIATALPAHGFVSRLSGDEFVILLPRGNTESIQELANRIIALLEIPFHMEDGDIYVSTNMGIASYPHDGESPELLLRNADLAMYAAKAQGRNTYQFFQPELQPSYTHRSHLDTYLRDAIR
ncbi:sensor domain-containing diguanylate cyclase [Paenibacillus roseipurpureus]|uniref:Sensor domain-containing diguanylate cyclase n=1 Tax=Paenibacillus roseopurpureus TaxID=2918901 RepID=A0AA96LV45_9BACL|nr:sensor domain-containing diguanylate cyclase [Paenibacillus sp. MBLB1832]WNR45205.1 sensor domain-containing diguanylate cyclase [Paenibacillus sp. MBLB1832]